MQRVKNRSPLQKLKTIARISTQTLKEMRAVVKAQGQSDSHNISWQEMSLHTRGWAQKMMRLLELEVEVRGAPFCSEACLLAGNHMSYLDIPVLMSLFPVTFVSKKEVLKWPLFGPAAKVAGTLFLDRSSLKSRKKIAEEIANQVKKQGKTIAIFPEGTSSIEGTAWKKGSFRMAQDHGFKVQAFSISYTPVRIGAFINNDSLLPHLWKFLDHSNKVTVQLAEPISITNPSLDCLKLQNWVQEKHQQVIKNDH